MKKRRFRRKEKPNEDMVLQITSMADIFTILLVFLLKSFSTGVSTLSPTGELVLPSAKNKDQIVETSKLEVASDGITLDDKVVTRLDQFKIYRDDLESDGTPRSLNAALIQVKPKEGNPTPPGHLSILADQKTPYAMIKRVLASASNHGFTDFHLVVVEEE